MTTGPVTKVTGPVIHSRLLPLRPFPCYGFPLSVVSLMLLPVSVSSPCTLLLTRFFSAFVSLPAFLLVLLMSCATLFRPPGCALCDPWMPVVFLRVALVLLPASLSVLCVLLASRCTSAFVSRPAFLVVLLTSCATLLRPPGL